MPLFHRTTLEGTSPLELLVSLSFPQLFIFPSSGSISLSSYTVDQATVLWVLHSKKLSSEVNCSWTVMVDWNHFSDLILILTQAAQRFVISIRLPFNIDKLECTYTRIRRIIRWCMKMAVLVVKVNTLVSVSCLMCLFSGRAAGYWLRACGLQ